MAKQTDLSLFLGTDFNWVFTILNNTETTVTNITGWALSFMVKANMNDADADALVTLTLADGEIVISGTYNSDIDTNTQVATVIIADTDTTSLEAGLRFWELKRTDAGYETILGYGQLDLIRSVHR